MKISREITHMGLTFFSYCHFSLLILATDLFALFTVVSCILYCQESKKQKYMKLLQFTKDINHSWTFDQILFFFFKSLFQCPPWKDWFCFCFFCVSVIASLSAHYLKMIKIILIQTLWREFQKDNNVSLTNLFALTIQPCW